MTLPIPLDAAWRRAHPLPAIGRGENKRDRGVVMAIGSSMTVPGALLLTGEAALRVGAGKVQLALPGDLIAQAGIAFPEAAVLGLGAGMDGELNGEGLAALEPRLGRSDALLIGPGMAERPHMAAMVERVLAALGEDAGILLDAGALTAARDCADTIRALGQRTILTPHPGELARLTDSDPDAVENDPEGVARDAADRFGCTIVLKSAVTHIAAPGEPLLIHEAPTPALGTAGSGDVLAGVIAGLLARGLTPLTAAAWGVSLHGLAGAAAGIGPFLARELLPLLSRVTAEESAGRAR